MNYKEYGKENNDVIILLHGGGLSWWSYQEEAQMLQSEYHVILPILDGHAGSDQDFTTIENNAAEIIAFIDEQFGGAVLLIGGLSLGGQVLLEILSRRSDICRYAIIESALVIPSKFTNSLYSIKESIVNCSAKAYIFVGKKENHAMRSSAKIIHEKLQGSVLQVLPKMHHGEFSINHATDYVNKVLEIVK